MHAANAIAVDDRGLDLRAGQEVGVELVRRADLARGHWLNEAAILAVAQAGRARRRRRGLARADQPPAAIAQLVAGFRAVEIVVDADEEGVAPRRDLVEPRAVRAAPRRAVDPGARRDEPAARRPRQQDDQRAGRFVTVRRFIGEDDDEILPAVAVEVRSRRGDLGEAARDEFVVRIFDRRRRARRRRRRRQHEGQGGAEAEHSRIAG